MFEINQKFTFTDLINFINLKSKYDSNDEISYKLYLAWKQREIHLQEKLNEVELASRFKNKPAKTQSKLEKELNKNKPIAKIVEPKLDFSELLKCLEMMKITNKVYISQVYEGGASIIRQEE